MTYSITSIEGVRATFDVLPVVKQFLSCPAAFNFLASHKILKPLEIQSTTELDASMEFKFSKPISESNPQHHLWTRIYIPKRELGSQQALQSLVFEASNILLQPRIKLLNREAEQGDLSMDDFAKKQEIIEKNTLAKHKFLNKECENVWGPLTEEMSERYQYEDDLSLFLFGQDLSCHTDQARKVWINKYQSIFCSKHPEQMQSRNCQTKVENLCNNYLSLSQSELPNFLADQLCKLYPSANTIVKQDPDYKKIFENHCFKKTKGHSEL